MQGRILYVHQYCHPVACCGLRRPAPLSHEITKCFCPGKVVAALSSLALVEGFFKLKLLKQLPELNWIHAIIQFLGVFQIVHPSYISKATLLAWILGHLTIHLQL
jgi:hypothetical protein